MKLSDYVIRFLAENLKVRHVFGIVGGANANLFDSLNGYLGIQAICTYHEQGAAIAAEAYARITGNIGAALVTSGPGGTNAITGLCCAYMDSIPCIFISGQVPLIVTADGNTIRQLGVQQINIVDGVKPYSKYAVMIKNAEEIRYHLEKAAFLAKSGRPGPVWLDIPTNLQHAAIDPNKIFSFSGDAEPTLLGNLMDDKKISQVCRMISESRRPIIIAGRGIRLSNPQGGVDELLTLVEKLKFPVITTWGGIDLINHNHPLYFGSAGVMGRRGANYAVANSDLIVAIGSRMDTRQVGNSPALYAREAKKIVVDIDLHELGKGLIKIDLPIKASAGEFMSAVLSKLEVSEIPDVAEWLDKCRQWRDKYPIVFPEFFQNQNGVNSYVFIDELCKHLDDDDIVVTDMGASLTCTMQTFRIKGHQRLLTNTGFAPMGYGLPAAVGAWFAGGGHRRIIGIFGDGGFQMNIQELQTLVHYKIPLKIFILNNRSYLTIKHTQEMFFDGRYSGSEPSSGYSPPDFCKIAKAYGIISCKLNSHSGMKTAINKVLNCREAILCEIMMPVNQSLIPLSVLDKSRQDASGTWAGSPIERMYPFLSEEEHRQNMLIEPV